MVVGGKDSHPDGWMVAVMSTELWRLRCRREKFRGRD